MADAGASRKDHPRGGTVITGEQDLGRFTPLLVKAILLTIAFILIVLVYGLVAGVLDPAAPRTAEEYTLVRAKAMVEQQPGNGQYWADYIGVMTGQGKYGRARDLIAEARESIESSTSSLLLVNNAELGLLLAQEQNEELIELADAYLVEDQQLREKELIDLAQKGVTVSEQYNQRRSSITIATLSMKARAAVELKEYDVALEALTRALELDPLAADVATFRGNVYVLKGDSESLELAREDFNRALQFIPDSEPALQGLQAVEELSGETSSTP